MNRMFNNIQRNWKRIVSVAMVLVLAITSVNMERNEKEAKAADGQYTFSNSNGVEVTAGGKMELRRAEDTLTISGYQTGNHYKWTSLNTNILTVDNTDSYSTSIRVANSVGTVQTGIQTGDVRIEVEITHGDAPNAQKEVIPLTISVVFSINESITDPTGKGVSIVRIHEGDARRALVMDCGASIDFGNSAQKEPDKLNLVFGDATATKATWRSSNDDVFAIVNQNGKRSIKAMGAGVATLTVEYSDDSFQYSDNIQVYVRPNVSMGGEVIAGHPATGGAITTQQKTIKNGDKLDISVLFDSNPIEAISDKLVWVISKGEGENSILVRDSLGNVGADGEDAKLTWLGPEAKQYRVDAKAGRYNIQFYVKGTYTSFEEAKAQSMSASGFPCNPVSLVAMVPANYRDKEATINLNGSYNLAEAFNIPADELRDKFEIRVDSGEGPYPNSNSYIRLASDGVTIMAAGDKNLGTGRVTIRPKDADINIPGVSTGNGLPEGREDLIAYAIVRVTEEFNLNQSSANMAIGSTLSLYGVIGSGTVAAAEDFRWTISDPSYLSIDTDSGQYATVTALKETPNSQPVVVTLTWMDGEGINHTASCSITIRKAVDGLTINPAAERLEAGGVTKILDTGLNGTQNFQWISSDTSRVTVTPLEGNTKATISAPAGATPGQAVITVINMDNGSFATCLVTVTAPITSITIDKGTDYRTTMAEGIVQMKAIYQPANATNVELIWTSSDEKVATVDEFGRVTLLREGDTYISVRPADNPNNVHADCFLHIVENPITQITPNVTELSMIAGDSYEVAVNILPENPSDRTLQWTSSNESIATVAGGVITAVSAGEAVISIAGGRVGRPVTAGSGESYIPPVTIRVKVRNRLQNIEFGQKVMYVPLGGTQELTVLFTPDVNINDKLIWNSSDTSIVTVSDEGVLTGVAVGSAMVTCYAEDLGPDRLISCMVYVTDQTIIPAAGLTLLPEESTLEVGQTLQMDAVFEPADTTNKYIQWSSSDENIATITPEGLVTAVEVGEATITAIYTDTPDGQPWILYSKITVIPATVEATGFDITPDSMNIKVKEHFTITPVFTPENTTDKSVEYQTTDESVATVSEKGVVTGVGAGDCIIQCQSNSGGFIATCAVHVENAISFHLSPSYREIAVGKSFTISKVTVPANADKTAVWTSSNTKIATVSSSGKVTAKKIGTCTITCTLTEYNQRATCRVKVAKLRSKVTLDKKNIRIGVGKTYRLKASVWTNDTKTPALKWKSSNKRIATVSSKGKIKGKQVGAAKITVTTKDKVKAKATCRVTVIKRASSIKINKRYAICYVGRTMKLKASVKPKSATIKKIKWSSSNKNIAVVSGSGKVTGISEGDVTITAKATDGSGKKVSCLVKVLEEVPATSVVVAQTKLTMKKGDSTKLTYSVLPNNTSDHISFASDNKRIATVNSNGKVKAVGTGTANITILAGSGITTTVTVNVVDLNKPSINMRQYDTETLQVFGTEDDVTWYSSNSRIATVDGGTVTGRGIGSTYIYAYVGGCKLACRVTITSVNR